MAYRTCRTTRSNRVLYRRLDEKVISGVCAGIADSLSVSVGLVRLGFILGTVFSGPLFVIIYVVATLALPKDYGPVGQPFDAYQPYPSAFSQPNPDYVQAQFSNMEHKLRGMEDYVTSKEFELRRKFETL